MLQVTTVWSGTMQGVPYFSQHYFGGTSELEATAARNALTTFWQGVDDRVVNNLTWTIQGDVEVIDPATGQITGVFGGVGATGNGADTGELTSAALQGLLRWRTGTFLGGREIRGRTFLPGVSEASSADGVPAATYITGMETAATNLRTSASTAGGLVVWARPRTEAPTRPGQTALVVSSSCWGQFAVLRSRRD